MVGGRFCENLLTMSRSCGRTLSGVRVAAMKSPGTVTRAPYKSSAEEHLRSSLGAAQMPSNTQGSASSQLGPESQALSEDFR